MTPREMIIISGIVLATSVSVHVYNFMQIQEDPTLVDSKIRLAVHLLTGNCATLGFFCLMFGAAWYLHSAQVAE